MSERWAAEKGSDLAAARIRAHQALDVIWWFGSMSRSEAYKWLAQEMHMKPTDCHIGMFDLTQCTEVERICASRSEHSDARKAQIAR